MPLTAFYSRPDGELSHDLSEEQVREAFESKTGLLWVDVEEMTDSDIDALDRVFGFHALALADCVSRDVHAPKIDDFGDHIFIIIHGVDYTSESSVVETTELALFIGSNFVVSSHSVPLFSIASVKRLVDEDGRSMRNGADFFAHVLMDALIDNILPAVRRLENIADDIEEEAIRNPQEETLEAALRLKRSALAMRRVVAPQREVLSRIARGQFPIVRDEVRIFYSDVYDDMVQIEDLTHALRERADTALTTYLSILGIRQNETMKVLAIVASIFLPLTLVAGIYGMNFENMPELGFSWGYFAVLGFMAFILTGAMWWFWASHWITWGRRQASRIRPFVVDTEKLIGYLGHIATTGPAGTKKADGGLLRHGLRRRKTQSR
jgi:magnesium transporter